VLFDVPSMPDYGRLSNRSADEMLAGARIEVAPYKRNAGDFVLWKPSTPDEPGWDSPWGRGRPGWHIECSAMSWKHLGETFDIHGGGIDLVFPHHENEVAQSRCAFGHDIMAQVWMHNGHLQVESEKMSKSIGNFITIRDLWATKNFGGQAWSGDALRLAMLRTHYRQPIDFTIRALEEAERTLSDFAKSAGDAEIAPPSAAFIEALEDDLNTPKALAELYALRSSNPGALKGSLALIGIGLAAAPEQEVAPPELEALLTRRKDARAAKNWAESDRIRDELSALGIAVKDNKDGTVSWERKK
jgi:cysteinyl-tRNA synthetase